MQVPNLKVWFMWLDVALLFELNFELSVGLVTMVLGTEKLFKQSNTI